MLDIIDNVKPVGICGSGIIDILAVLLKNHVMNRRGKMYSKAEYEEKYGADKLSERLIKMPIKSDDGETTREQNVFVLATAEESGTDSIVYFAQTDARYVQLAKAAIATGTEVLVDIYKLDRTEFYEVCLAGAFGNYLDVDNAQYIGLLPDYEGVPVRSIGNGAGTGVQLFLLDQAVHKRCQRVQKNAHHTELNSNRNSKMFTLRRWNLPTQTNKERILKAARITGGFCFDKKSDLNFRAIDCGRRHSRRRYALQILSDELITKI